MQRSLWMLPLIIFIIMWSLASYVSGDLLVVEPCLAILIVGGLEMMHSFFPSSSFSWTDLALLGICGGLLLYWPLLIFYFPALLFIFHLSYPVMFGLILIESLISHLSLILEILVLATSILCLLIRQQTEQFNAFRQKTHANLDTLRFDNVHFKRAQDRLLSQQNQRIATSIRQERLRIVRDIHDLLGHQLTGAIVQLTALEMTSKDTSQKSQLSLVTQQLKEAMENVRTVIHQEQATSYDLKSDCQQIIDQFKACPVTFTFQGETPLKANSAHSVLNILQEALTNAAKYAQATLIQIQWYELQDRYTLLIADNGKAAAPASHSGIGLLNMEKRVQEMGGSFHLNTIKGYRIFISLPKEMNQDETFTR